MQLDKSLPELKPLHFFDRNAPPAFQGAKLFATNPAGDIVYAVRLDLSYDFDEETGGVVSHKEMAVICQHLVATGESITYNIDESIQLAELRRYTDFYLLSDDVGVFVTYARNECILTQILIFLDKETKIAKRVMARKTETPAITYSLTLGTGRLSSGQILVTGSRGPIDGDRDVVGYIVPANPGRKEKVEEITGQIAEFTNFLKSDYFGCKISPNSVFIDDKALYFLVRCGQQEELRSGMMGRYLFQPEENEPKCSVLYFGNRDLDISARHLKHVVQRGRNLWLFLTPPDHEEMANWSWRLYLWAMPYVLRTMVWSLNVTIWMRRFDGGFMIRMYIKLLQWAFGPSMIPRLEADPVPLLYNLDLHKRTVKKAHCQLPPSKKNPITFTCFNVVFDCDKDGGLIFARLPSEEEKNPKISLTHYSSQPMSLAKMASHTAYRAFPAYEKSSLWRRSLGTVNGAWKL